MTRPPDTVAELCAELRDLYRALGEAITPTAERPDRSMARDATTRWCAFHEHLVPYGPVEKRCNPGAPKLTLAAAITPTARPDNGSRRGVPGSRPPLSGPAYDALVAQEGIWKAAEHAAGLVRAALGHQTRDRSALTALGALPDLVDALEREDLLRGHVERALRRARQRARDVLGLSRDVKWLGECPGLFDRPPFPVLTRDGLVTDEGEHLRCWTLDLAVDSDDEVWRRSRLALVRDEERPRVLCFACGYTPDDAALVKLALPLLPA